MKVILAPIGWVVVYGVLYFGAVFCALFVSRWRRKTRWPFKETEKLVRGPGETLRRQVIDIDERFVIYLVFGLGIGAFAYMIGLYMVQWLKLVGFVGSAVAWAPAVVAIGLIGWGLSRLFNKRSNAYLGWFGERMVAEKTAPLLVEGYRIFHDMPAQGARKPFNLDHVVIGPGGVTVIEVKTRRKGNARPGAADHKVAFDGTKLLWPWGDDEKCVEQALNEAEWLAKWIFERTGLKVPVRPVLTLPGWYVSEAPNPRIRVVNPNILPDAIRGRWAPALKPDQIDLITRQIELVCRDVED